MTRYSTPAFQALKSAQNSEQYIMIDILTITGFMDDEALLKHVSRYTGKVWTTLEG